MKRERIQFPRLTLIRRSFSPNSVNQHDAARLIDFSAIELILVHIKCHAFVHDPRCPALKLSSKSRLRLAPRGGVHRSSVNRRVGDSGFRSLLPIPASQNLLDTMFMRCGGGGHAAETIGMWACLEDKSWRSRHVVIF